jgi:hypothetical protein
MSGRGDPVLIGQSDRVGALLLSAAGICVTVGRGSATLLS